MKTITLESIVLRNPEIVHRTIDNDIVMMSIRKNNFYGINEIGSKIWNMLENETQVNKLVEKLIQLYSVDNKTCTNDVIDFLKEVLKHELIVVK